MSRERDRKRDLRLAWMRYQNYPATLLREARAADRLWLRLRSAHPFYRHRARRMGGK